jgi:hypothetical protein
MEIALQGSHTSVQSVTAHGVINMYDAPQIVIRAFCRKRYRKPGSARAVIDNPLDERLPLVLRMLIQGGYARHKSKLSRAQSVIENKLI